jgi:hypothetical protein
MLRQWQASIQRRVGLTQNFKGGNDPPLQNMDPWNKDP